MEVYLKQFFQVGLVLLLVQVVTSQGLPATFEPDAYIFYEDNGACETGTGEFAIVIHGWTEGCSSTEWIPEMMSNLTEYRGGCVICMDYSKYSKADYFRVLVPHFELVVQNLLWKLQDLQTAGFNLTDGFVFGFSFGSQVAIEAGRRLGPTKLSRIDACDPAGPGFDSNSKFAARNPQLAAGNVQCIHTNIGGYGTTRSNCHQDWNMGNCGRSQPANGPKPKGSHGLCPFFYTSAFANLFLAIPKPKTCSANRLATSWPSDFRMGYFMDVDAGVTGTLFAATTKKPPYN